METLVANAIHDIKNSLHALNSRLSEAEHQAPSAALSAARSLSTHINGQLVQLLTLFREGEGTLRLSVDDRDLYQFIEELRLEPLSSAHANLTITYELDAVAQIGTWAFDAYQVKLVLADALRNACRHAHSRVVFRVLPSDTAGIEFAVTDDGNGFPKQILAGDEVSMGEHGSGLGLRFARLITTRHRTPDGRQGELLLDNPPEGGARLRLRLP